MTLAQFSGVDLGSEVVGYDERDAILYALAVGAKEIDLNLVFERDLKVLPTFGLTLGRWVADAASRRGVFRPESALHGAQALRIHQPLPKSARVRVNGRIGAIWDKGRSAIVEVVAECEYFTATYSIFLPGQGGWGGEQGSRGAGAGVQVPTWRATVSTLPQQAALYRLTGDWHLIHIDREAAVAAGLPGPILHGLCTLGIAARELAVPAEAEPWQLTGIEARFSAPVVPGENLDVEAETMSGVEALRFRVSTPCGEVLRGGVASFQLG